MLNIVATATTAATIISKTTNSAMKSAANIATGRAATTTHAAATATTTGWSSGINGLLNNIFLNTDVTGLFPGEEHERSETLCATEYLTRLLDKACR